MYKNTSCLQSEPDHHSGEGRRRGSCGGGGDKFEDLYMMYNQTKWEELVVWDKGTIRTAPLLNRELLIFSGII